MRHNSNCDRRQVHNACNILLTVKVAYAADPTVAIATLENTATSGWGSNKAAATVNTESGLEHFNNDTDTSWAGTAFAQFTLADIS